MGKNFSANNIDGKRKASDFYETPYSLTDQFLLNQPFINLCPVYTVLDPACGSKAIGRVLCKHGYNPVEQDISTGDDFLKYSGSKVDLIITNPPYSLAYEFILKAKDVSNRYIAFLLPLSYLHGKARFDNIWTDTKFPLSQVYVFTRYPLLGETLREDGKYHTGMMVYAWFVWCKQWNGEPIIRWLDNNEYVLSSKVQSKCG